MEKSPWDDISLYIEHRVICEVNCFDDETCIKKKKKHPGPFLYSVRHAETDGGGAEETAV